MKKILLLLSSVLLMTSCHDLLPNPYDCDNNDYYPPTYDYNNLGCNCGEIVSINNYSTSSNLVDIGLVNKCSGDTVVFTLSIVVLDEQNNYPGNTGYVCLNTTW